MFKVKWDAQNNGIILSDNITDEAIPAPRPVYLQELQILEVNKKYRMPKTDLPICWNIDAQYLYLLENVDFTLFSAIYLLIYSIFTPILSQYFQFGYFFFFLFF